MASRQMDRIKSTKHRLDILKEALKDHAKDRYNLAEILALAIEVSDFEEIINLASRANFDDLWRTVAGIKAIILWDYRRLIPLINSLSMFILPRKCFLPGYFELLKKLKKDDKKSFSTVFAAAAPLAIFEAYNAIEHEMAAEMRQQSKEVIVDFIKVLGLMPDYEVDYRGRKRGSITDYVGGRNYNEYTSRMSSAAKLFFMCEPELSKRVISAVQIDPPTNCIAEDIVSQIVYAVLSPLKCNMHILAADAVLVAQIEAAEKDQK